MTEVDLDLTWASAASAASGNGKLQWRGETIEFNGSVASPLDLFAGKGSSVRFAIASTPLRVSFNGKALGLDGADFEGDASVSTPSLRKVVAWLGTPLGNGSILGPASIEGKLSWHGSGLSFSKASFSLDGNEAQGVASIDFGGARPAIQGTFAAAKLDLSPYFEAVRADMSANGPWPFAATRLPIADLVDCDLRLSVSEVLIGSVRLTGFGATGTIKDGAVTVNIGQAKVYGGKLGATIATRMDGDRLAAHVKATIDGALAQAPLKDLLDIGALSGKAHASIDINGGGATWGELVHSIAGNASIAIADGTLDRDRHEGDRGAHGRPARRTDAAGGRLGGVRQARRNARDRQQHPQHRRPDAGGTGLFGRAQRARLADHRLGRGERDAGDESRRRQDHTAGRHRDLAGAADRPAPAHPEGRRRRPAARMTDN